MKILVVNNIYPPAYIGGYELGCRDAVDALRERGHDVVVLTSSYPDGVSRIDGHIQRKLTMVFGRVKYRKVVVRELRNQSIFRHYCRKFEPEVIFFWNISGISMALMPLARLLGHRICFYVFDSWIADWQSDRFVELGTVLESMLHVTLPKYCLGFRLKIDSPHIENVIYATKYLLEVTEDSIGKVKNAAVLPWGVDTSKFRPIINSELSAPSRVLYVGQVVQHKGVHVAIRALALARKHYDVDLHLTVVGDMELSPEYVEGLKLIIRKLELSDHITFTGKIERDLLPDVYASHDILIFPSIWDEPFGLTLLEAMASGLAVVASGTGGSKEFLMDGVNSLLYKEDDPDQCAEKIISLCTDRVLFDAIRQNGRQVVETHYSLHRAIDDIEDYLEKLLTE